MGFSHSLGQLRRLGDEVTTARWLRLAHRGGQPILDRAEYPLQTFIYSADGAFRPTPAITCGAHNRCKFTQRQLCICVANFGNWPTSARRKVRMPLTLLGGKRNSSACVPRQAANGDGPTGVRQVPSPSLLTQCSPRGSRSLPPLRGSGYAQERREGQPFSAGLSDDEDGT